MPSKTATTSVEVHTRVIGGVKVLELDKAQLRELTEVNIASNRERKTEIKSRFMKLGRITKIVSELAIPILSIIIIYLSFSPVAFTNEYFVKDMAYSVKDIISLNNIFVTMGIIVSVASLVVYFIGDTYYKEIVSLVNRIKLAEKDDADKFNVDSAEIKADTYSTETFVSEIDVLKKNMKEYKYAVYKALLFVAFIAVAMVTNYFIH